MRESAYAVRSCAPREHLPLRLFEVLEREIVAIDGHSPSPPSWLLERDHIDAALLIRTGDLLITNQLAEALFSEEKSRFLPQTPGQITPWKAAFCRERCLSLWHWFVARVNALALTDGPRPVANFPEGAR